MEIRIYQILFQIINFAIVLYAFNRFLIGPILKVLDDRTAKVKDGLQAAEKNIKLQSELENEKDVLLKDAKTQANKIVKDAKIEADTLIKNAKDKAKEEAKAVLAKERSAFQSQMELQVKEFESKLARTVNMATNAVLRDVVDAKIQEEIIDKQIKQLNIKL